MLLEWRGLLLLLTELQSLSEADWNEGLALSICLRRLCALTILPSPFLHAHQYNQYQNVEKQVVTKVSGNDGLQTCPSILNQHRKRDIHFVASIYPGPIVL